MSAERKEYQLCVNMVIETYPKLTDKIEEELINAIVAVVEKHNSFVGGGLMLIEYKDE